MCADAHKVLDSRFRGNEVKEPTRRTLLAHAVISSILPSMAIMDLTNVAQDPLAKASPFVRVEGRHGSFMVNRHDLYVGSSLIYYGEYCEMEWQFFRRFIALGMDVVDAGANQGSLAVPMAKHVGDTGNVYAFEPQPALFMCLQAAKEYNHLPQLHPIQMGLGDAEGEMETALPDYNSFDSFGSLSLLKPGTGLKVGITTLDKILAGTRIGFMKIDIEGMEIHALKGATEILKQRPVLYIENDKRERSSGLLQMLFDMNYKIWWHTTPMYNANNFRHNAENIYSVISNINIICLPAERAHLHRMIPASLIPVNSAEDSLYVPEGIIPSPADDVTGI